MFHVAIIGLTGSGKTFLARQLARIYKNKGEEVLCLHKEKEPWLKNEVNLQTSNIEIFLQKIEERNMLNSSNSINSDSLKGYVLFMELADADADKYDLRVRRLFRQGRHDGHKIHYLTQRSKTVHPDVRENCHELMLFACSANSAKEWSEEFNAPILKSAKSLPKYQFFHCRDRFTKPVLRTLQV